jgi:hypothetical protein
MEKCLMDRAQIPENQIFDIHFADLVSDSEASETNVFSFGLSY